MNSTPRRASRAPLKLPRPEERYAIAGGALRVSPFCLGTVAEAESVLAAFDAGINFFFLTADMHWPLYENLRRGLELLFARGGSLREDVVVAVVSYVAQPEFTQYPIIEAIKAVKGLERADMTIVGGTYAADLVTRLDRFGLHRASFNAAKLGTKATGVTFHDRRAACMAINGDLVDLAFVRYNPEHRGAERDLFPYLRPDGKCRVYNFLSTLGYLSESVFDKMGLTADHWRPHVSDYYRYALTRPELDGVLCSLDKPAHVRDLVDAIDRGPLDEEDVRYLQKLGALSAGRAKVASPSDTPGSAR